MEESRAMLVAMGFDPTAVQNALEVTAGNVENAANFLLAGTNIIGADTAVSNNNNNNNSSSSSTGTESCAPSLPPITIVQGSLSQYSVENGRSACTYMALAGAVNFLQSDNISETLVDSSFLDEMVRQGSEIYKTQDEQKQNTLEHTSAEEVLTAGLFPHLTLTQNGICQGLISNDLDNLMGLHALLTECQSKSDWTCVVITKPPETVLICLPPKDNSVHEYLWIDSHPRPSLGITQVSCRRHASLIDLVQHTALVVFPATELGEDIPEYMQTMYNSFDLYPLKWKQ